MTTPLRASWSFNVPDKTSTSSSAVEFPSKGEKTIDVKQGNLVELNEGIHQIRDNLNDLLTHWKDIVGDEGQGKDRHITKTEQQDNEEEVDDESSEGEE